MATVARKKAWRPKSKTGCSTCRIRRVKCGEEKPYCLRCTKTGRRCDGYNNDQQAGSSLALTSPQRTKFSQVPSPTLVPSTSIEGDEQERRSFHFFLDRTAPELAGYYECQFWSRLVLQRCHSDDAIRHAVIALGALHESYKSGDIRILEGESVRDPQQRLALVQNNKAIRHLTSHLSHGGTPHSAEVILTCCLLFVCFEAMQGNYQAAFTHLNSGLKILGEWLERTKQNSTKAGADSNLAREFIENELMPLFGTLDIQSTTILPTSSIQWGMTVNRSKVDFKTENNIPGSFSSINEARICLENRTHWILGFHQNTAQRNHSLSQELPSSPIDRGLRNIMEEKSKQALGLEQWSNGFCNLVHRIRPTMNSKDLRASLSLKLYHTVVKLILETALFASEMDYDKYMSEFELIMSLADTLLDSYGNTRTELGRVFSFNTAIVPPLLCVVCKCRDPGIRRKAWSLLSTSARREGGWDSDYATSIGRWTIDKEEEGLEQISKAEQVPEATRVVVAEILSVGRRRALVKYWQGPRPASVDVQLKEEWISW
ncbi:hypothetical protein ACMFMG_000542 [Clarireedia jacksonii]